MPELTPLTVSATAHGLNYLPEYLANHRGLFAEHDLKVTAQARDPWIGVLDDLDTGVADIALGGLWVPAMYAGTARELVVVGQLNARSPRTVFAGLRWRCSARLAPRMRSGSCIAT